MKQPIINFTISTLYGVAMAVLLLDLFYWAK